jgi:preprotein translocase subunit SecD|tara:strand:+ start:743 stop:973 length:231 start_codon:yes stop_codon:yes gene_type:complete
MKNKKSKLFNMLAWAFVLIVLITFVLTYPGLAKETGKALTKTTGAVVNKGIDIVKGSETVKKVTSEAINKTIEVIG